MRNRDTWVLVADGVQARLFRADRRKHMLEPMDEWHSDAARGKGEDIVSDRPGHYFDGNVLGQRSAMEPPTDPKTLEKRRFARHLAERLDESGSAGRFESLVVVAAPQTLGDLRERMSASLRDRIEAEIDKDLTKVDPAALAKHLAPVLWPLAG